MRAIIIDDKDCKSLVEKLALTYERLLNEWPNGRQIESPCDAQELIRKLHGTFHYHAVKWLQDQGWNST